MYSIVKYCQLAAYIIMQAGPFNITIAIPSRAGRLLFIAHYNVYTTSSHKPVSHYASIKSMQTDFILLLIMFAICSHKSVAIHKYHACMYDFKACWLVEGL